MNYKTNRADVAAAEDTRKVEGVMQYCTLQLCPMFHVYGGDCHHAMEAEDIGHAFEENWRDASAHVWTRYEARRPRRHDAHVEAWENEYGICF